MTLGAEKTIAAIEQLLGDPADRYAGKLLWHHCGDSRHCSGSPGLPDLIIAGPGGLLLAEIKPSGRSHLSPGQTSWAYMLIAGVGRLAHVVWTAADLASGDVRQELERLLAPRR